jgi:hypothetical protein
LYKAFQTPSIVTNTCDRIERKGKSVPKDRAKGSDKLDTFLKVLLNGSQCQLSIHWTGSWVGPKADLDTVTKRETSVSIAILPLRGHFTGVIRCWLVQIINKRKNHQLN